MLNKYQLKANKTNKKQLSTTLSTVIHGHWSLVLGFVLINVSILN